MATYTKLSKEYLTMIMRAVDLYSQDTVLKIADMCLTMKMVLKFHDLVVNKELSEEEMIKVLEETKVPKK